MASAKVISEFEVLSATDVGRRRVWSAEDKIRVVEESLRGWRQGSATARRLGREPLDLLYDLMLEQDGRAILYFPSFNYSYGVLSQVHEMLGHPSTVNSLADGGAHCGYICDVSLPTFMLTHWTRDRQRGPRHSIEAMVRRQAWETAALYGLTDRGRLAPGLKADVNVIDYERLRLHAPRMVRDLPAGGRRLIQEVDGYVATLVAGEPIFENGRATGALPGRLLAVAVQASV